MAADTHLCGLHRMRTDKLNIMTDQRWVLYHLAMSATVPGIANAISKKAVAITASNTVNTSFE